MSLFKNRNGKSAIRSLYYIRNILSASVKKKPQGEYIDVGISNFDIGVLPVLYKDAISAENINVGISNFDIGVKQVFYRDTFSAENVSVGIADLAITVTPIGV